MELEGKVKKQLNKLDPKSKSSTKSKAKGPSGGDKPKAKKQATYTRSGRTWEGRTFASPEGVPILVGRNRRENDFLTLSVARDPDVWMHVRGSPGAHVVLQMSKAPAQGKPPTDLCMSMAANLAVFYSDLRSEGKALVMHTSPKHIRKPNKAPLGAVRVLKEMGTVLGIPEDVPEELKALREQEKFENGGGRGSGVR